MPLRRKASSHGSCTKSSLSRALISYTCCPFLCTCPFLPLTARLLLRRPVAVVISILVFLAKYFFENANESNRRLNTNHRSVAPPFLEALTSHGSGNDQRCGGLSKICLDSHFSAHHQASACTSKIFNSLRFNAVAGIPISCGTKVLASKDREIYPSLARN